MLKGVCAFTVPSLDLMKYRHADKLQARDMKMMSY
jgi:hypothetical protein